MLPAKGASARISSPPPRSRGSSPRRSLPSPGDLIFGSAPAAGRSPRRLRKAAPRSSPTKSTRGSSRSSARNTRAPATLRYIMPISARSISTTRRWNGEGFVQARGKHPLPSHEHDSHRSRPAAPLRPRGVHGPAGGRRENPRAAGESRVRNLVDFPSELLYNQ